MRISASRVYHVFRVLICFFDRVHDPFRNHVLSFLSSWPRPPSSLVAQSSNTQAETSRARPRPFPLPALQMTDKCPWHRAVHLAHQSVSDVRAAEIVVPN